MTINAETMLTISDLLNAMRQIECQLGEGYLSYGLRSSGQHWVSHWHPAARGYGEDCTSIAVGDLASCLAGMERYAQSYSRKVLSNEDVARTLGLEPDGSFHRPSLLAAE